MVAVVCAAEWTFEKCHGSDKFSANVALLFATSLATVLLCDSRAVGVQNDPVLTGSG